MSEPVERRHGMGPFWSATGRGRAAADTVVCRVWVGMGVLVEKRNG